MAFMTYVPSPVTPPNLYFLLSLTRKIIPNAVPRAYSLTLALHSPSMTIYLTDLPHLLPTLTSNLSLNAPLSSVHPAVLSWGEAPIPSPLPQRPDVLLAADCVYFEPAFPLLLDTMRALIGRGTVCYFCFVKRRRADLGFLKKLRKVFDVRELTEGWKGEEDEDEECEGDDVGKRDAGMNEDSLGNSVGVDGDESVELKKGRRKQRIFM